jgi:hypothetical protein
LRRSLHIVALLVLATQGGCGERRDEARLAALESGIASARASLSAVSASFPATSPAGIAAVPSIRPVGALMMTTAAAPSGDGAPRPRAASELLGADPEALRRWFGDPDLRRPEGGGEVRLYLGPGCALDVVLYASGGGMRVAHAVARADGAAAVTEADCLRGLGGGGGAAGRTMAAAGGGGGQ